jgi:hypothetical protein
MKNINIIIIFISVLFTSCYFKLTHKQNEINPTEYLFDFPINQVRDSILSGFCCYKYQKMNFSHGVIGSESDSISGEENKNTFFLGQLYTSSGKSHIYYNWWGRLNLYSEFRISLDSISTNKTKVKIDSRLEVKTGLKIAINHFLPYLTAHKEKVKASTIEEYQIIKSLGDILGQENMPNIKFAKHSKIVSPQTGSVP